MGHFLGRCTLYGMLSTLAVVYAGYKEEHQGFVKNFKGTSAGYVIVCLAHVPASILLLKIVQGSSRPSFLRDLLCLVLPILLNLTLLADYCYFTIVLLIGCEAVFIFKINPYRVRKESDDVAQSVNGLQDEESSSLFDRCKGTAYLNLFKGTNKHFYPRRTSSYISMTLFPFCFQYSSSYV